MAANLVTLLLSLALVAVGGEEVDRTAVDSALVRDDLCAAEGGEKDGALCALSALQAKVQKLAAGEEAEKGDPCRSGIVGQIRSIGESCLEACAQMCRPLEEAVAAFLMGGAKGGAFTVMPVVCEHQEHFACAVSDENLEKCQPLISQAQGFGFSLPSTRDQLSALCR